MAQRFTDTQKWEDEWFTELSNDYKVIWMYLLDTCDNAGIWKQNIKLLNFSCNTDVSINSIAEIFKGRITKIDTDKWIINKFCVFQYGPTFLTSGNKAVISAIKKLIIAGCIDVNTNGTYSPKIVFDNTIDTLSIPYQSTTDSIKDKEEDKDQDKFKDKTEEELQEYVEYIAETEEWNKLEQKEILNKFDSVFGDVK
jgi:hypothetical protein